MTASALCRHEMARIARIRRHDCDASIREALAEYEILRTGQVAREIGLATKTVGRHLARLEEAGTVRRTDTMGYWELTAQGRGEWVAE